MTTALLFITTLLLFASSTAQWGLHTTLVMKRYKSQFMDNPTFSLQQRLDVSQIDFAHVEMPIHALLLLNV